MALVSTHWLNENSSKVKNYRLFMAYAINSQRWLY